MVLPFAAFVLVVLYIITYRAYNKLLRHVNAPTLGVIKVVFFSFSYFLYDLQCALLVSTIFIYFFFQNIYVHSYDMNLYTNLFNRLPEKFILLWSYQTNFCDVVASFYMKLLYYLIKLSERVILLLTDLSAFCRFFFFKHFKELRDIFGFIY